jgi:CheY-like chemotaxis protein
MNKPDTSKCRSILVVEDEKGIQEVLKIALEMEGYIVYTADNGKAGMEMLPSIPTPCLILLDLMMPVMNGWQFVEVISKDITLATIPVVIVTAYGDRAKSIPSKGILKKPIDLDSLLKTVEKWCNGITK